MARDHVSAIKVWPCDNCGSAHVGRYIIDHYFEGTETDFEWTDWQGNIRVCSECGYKRDPCDQPSECWRCAFLREKARVEAE